MDTNISPSPAEKCKDRELNRVESFSEDHTALKEDMEDKKPLTIYIHNNEKTIINSDVVPSSQSLPRQKSRFFRGGKKLSRNMWTSMVQEKTAKKNRVLKSEKSMDDAMLLPGKTMVERGTNFDTLPEDVCRESFTDMLRRGGICEEIEKGIVQGGISLHEMRKAMVVEETLKERFLM